MSWTPDQVAFIKKSIKDGLSAKQVSEALGVTRNSVVAKSWRLGLRFGSSPAASPRSRAQHRKAHPEASDYVTAVYQRQPRHQPYKPRPQKAMPETIATENNVRLVDLAFHSCRWPVAMVEGEHLFCGAQRDDASSNCAEHRRMAHQPGKPSWRRAA